MANAYLSIGSNVEAEKYISAGVHSLKEIFGTIHCSTVYLCPAEGFDGDDFLNMAAIIETDILPEQLKDKLHAIEHTHGRTRGSQRFTDRTLDIDLVMYDDLIMDKPGLQLPRDELEKYAFVLAPLAEIAPLYKHPVSGLTLQQLWESFDKSSVTLEAIELGF